MTLEPLEACGATIQVMNGKKSQREILLGDNGSGSIAKDLQQLRSSDAPRAENPQVIESPETIKRELYAISAFLMEGIFPQIEAWIKQNPNTVPARIFGEKKDGISGHEIDSPYMTDQLQRRPVYGLQYFLNRTGLSEIFGEFLNKTLSEKPREGKATYAISIPDAKQRERLLRAYKRMEQLLADKKYEPFANSKQPTVENFIGRGANTAYNASWDMMLTIPILWRSNFGADITREEYERVIRNSRKTAVLLASMHLDNFLALQDFVDKDFAKGRFVNALISHRGEPRFPAEFFVLADIGDEIILQIDNKVLTEWEEAQVQKGIKLTEYKRFGCPARDTRVESEGKKISVIDFVYDYVGGLAVKMIAPNVTKFVDDTLSTRHKAM